MLFEPGPWDKRKDIESAHVFSQKRKLLYGAEHDRADIDDTAKDGYGVCAVWSVWSVCTVCSVCAVCAVRSYRAS